MARSLLYAALTVAKMSQSFLNDAQVDWLRKAAALGPPVNNDAYENASSSGKGIALQQYQSYRAAVVERLRLYDATTMGNEVLAHLSERDRAAFMPAAAHTGTDPSDNTGPQVLTFAEEDAVPLPYTQDVQAVSAPAKWTMPRDR